MIYVALLRGINVGGNNKASMAELKEIFEKLGHSNVLTYINSGNIIFSSSSTDTKKLAETIEKELESHFGFFIPTIVKSKPQIEAIHKALPTSWANDPDGKCDILFLWDEINSAKIIDNLPIRPGYDDDVHYVDGAVIWHIERKNITKTWLPKIVGTDLYKKMTIRSSSTLRKLHERM